MSSTILSFIKSNDSITLQNYILSQQHYDTFNNTLLLICRSCIDFDNNELLKITLEHFTNYNQHTHEIITKYCCSRGSLQCLKTLVQTFDYSISSLCYKTLVMFGRKIRYIKCLRFLFEEFECPFEFNLFENCYDLIMFECLLSFKLKYIEQLDEIILLRFANQLFEEEEHQKYPLAFKYIKSKHLL